MAPPIETEPQLEAALSEPTPEVCDALARLDGDLMLLGVGGKMGPTMAKMARRAIDLAGLNKRVIGVARFSAPGLEEDLNRVGVETIACDLLADHALELLPCVPNIVYLVGMKFGTTGAEALTWAMNVYLPALVARRFRSSRIVALSTGNVYPLTPVGSGGPTEEHPTGPVGEYAQSCLGRERMFQYFSGQYGTKVTLIRLNYAIDLRYGVLLDVAQRVYARMPVDLTMGYANVIWQRDANVIILRSLELCDSPPAILNLTGPETLSIRAVAKRFGETFGIEPQFAGAASETALLSNASKCWRLFGPSVPHAVSSVPHPTGVGHPEEWRTRPDQMIEWIAHWVKTGGRTLGKPTHFEQRDGKF
jgi:nucleoside-diphosphate-sugar epimerase